jgi:hypothetical protein
MQNAHRRRDRSNPAALGAVLLLLLYGEQL